jgi:hypothetical protein
MTRISQRAHRYTLTCRSPAGKQVLEVYTSGEPAVFHARARVGEGCTDVVIRVEPILT